MGLFGSSKPVTTTNVTTQQLSPEQQTLLGYAMPQLQQAAENPPQLPGFSNVAAFDPMQTAGQEQVLQAAQGYSGALTGAQNAYQAAAPQLQGTADQASQTYNTMTSGELLNPNSNPALKAHMDSAISSAAQPLYQGLAEQVLPNIRGGAVTTGYGSSRQGIAEGLAAGRTAQEVGRQGQGIATSLADAGYGRGLDAMGRALGLTSQVQGAQLAPAGAAATAAGLAGEQVNPALWTSGVGDVRQANTQAQLQEQTDRFNYEQQLPLLLGKEYAGIAAGLPGGGTTTIGTAPATTKSPLMSGLGGAAAGAQIGSVIPGLGTGIGALIGGGIGLLGA